MLRLAAAIALIASCFFASPAFAFRNFSVPSNNMMPLLGSGDIVTATFYGVDYEAIAKGEALTRSEDPAFQPKRGDVAFFTTRDGTAFVMRIVGIGGDRVQMLNGELHLNGEPVALELAEHVEQACPEEELCSFFREALPGELGSHIVMSQQNDSPGDHTKEFVVPDGHFFLMGDNRDRSADSRFVETGFSPVGFVPRAAMIGRLHTILYSPRSLPPTAERLRGFSNHR